MDCPWLDCPHHDFVGHSCNLDGLHPNKESVLIYYVFCWARQKQDSFRVLSSTSATGFVTRTGPKFLHSLWQHSQSLFLLVHLFSGLLLKANWFGVPGWRWLFIVEGVPAIIFGIVTLFYLTDWPHQARWLPDDEKEWLGIRTGTRKNKRSKARILWESCKLSGVER